MKLSKIERLSITLEGYEIHEFLGILTAANNHFDESFNGKQGELELLHNLINSIEKS